MDGICSFQSSLIVYTKRSSAILQTKRHSASGRGLDASIAVCPPPAVGDGGAEPAFGASAAARASANFFCSAAFSCSYLTRGSVHGVLQECSSHRDTSEL